MDASNIIITVGRQLGSGGKEIAALLAQRLAYKMYDQELLNLAAKESGLCERLFERNDEQKAFSKSLAVRMKCFKTNCLKTSCSSFKVKSLLKLPKLIIVYLLVDVPTIFCENLLSL